MPPVRPKNGPSKPSVTAYTTSSILKSVSVLTKPSTNLHAFLLLCLTSWPDYTEAQKHQIISSLPPAYQIRKTDAAGNIECPLSMDFVRSDPHLREGIEKFKRDVGEGYFDPAWRKTAAVAMREREEGKFDEYLREKVEAEYGDVQPEEDERESGESGESDKEWGKEKVKGKGKIAKGGKGKGRPRAAAARGEMQSTIEMED